MIDLHLVKHSGIGQSSGGVGRGKSRMVGSVFSCFQNFFPFFSISAANGECSGFIS